MKKAHPAVDTSMLPQYRESAAFMERFLVAVHVDGSAIERSPNNKGIKLVDGTELSIDVLSYFTENKEEFRKEFVSELEGVVDRSGLDLFCKVVASDWFDGARLRREGSCQRLKRSVLDYLLKLAGCALPLEQVVRSSEDLSKVEPLIAAEDIEKIIVVNNQMLYRHIEAWKISHPNSDSMSDSDVFLRRGVVLNDEIDTSKPYCEWDFINSYSIAFSASEKFSQMVKAGSDSSKSALLNGELAIFMNRVLFFSPFIPGMAVGQLEFGIIPSMRPLPIHCQGIHGGILEYIIDPVPFHI
ncbi:hypothetical protein [Pseudomonas syringae]|uniref:hypothetical protein n=1 Tax=Pseudomonas syringae TaxID=317 RepID=UPI000CD12F71|nr:hypothetical protein [Pseudomonas syringae]POD54614.1 hypothetical protein BKM15_05600 [Pseudomonas syringae pv. syringae]MCF5732949.1 hypothetical protein [Pseudomonas syringae]MCF5738824.1 hypothetical protein [Pseudomonas syringae]MCF5751829.1 hypothetical protein [Pseudomonas syringae]MCF5757852.1 hypothetical protein [Pseudomonas syringae]